MELSDKKRIFFNTILMTVSTVVEKMLFFIINIIIARYLDIDLFGEYSTALAFASFFSLLTDLGINEVLIRELNYEKENDFTIFNTIILKAFLSVVLFIIFGFATSLTGYSDELVYLTIVFGLVRFGDEYLRLYYTYYEGRNRYYISAIFRLLFALSFLIAIVIVVWIKGGNREIAWLRFFVVIIFFILLSILVLRGKKKRLYPDFIKSYIRKTKPFASAFISTNIINQGNLVILPLLHGAYYTGIFQNAYIFIFSIMFIPISFGRVFIPYLYQHNRDDGIDKFQFAFDIITKSYVFISFFIASVLFIYSDFLIKTIFGSKYTESILLLKILSLGIPFLFNASYIIITALDKQRLYSGMLKYIAVASIILNVFLCYFFKDDGIAVATVLTFVLIFLLSNFIIVINTDLCIKKSLITYIKGGIIVFICVLIHKYFFIISILGNMVLTSAIFGVLTIVFLFTKDDIRIAKEILGK